MIPGIAPQNAQTNPYVRDLSDASLGEQMAGVQSTGGLNIQFFYARVPTSGGDVQTRLCIAKQPKGDRMTIATRQISEDAAARHFPREFAMFKQHEEMPTEGTPLHELPGATQSEIAILTLHGLRSIEDLVEINEDTLQQIGMDAINAQKRAKLWDAKRNENDEIITIADLQAQFGRQEKNLRRELDALREANAKLAAENNALAKMNPGTAVSPLTAGVPQAVEGEFTEPMPDPSEDGFLSGEDVSSDDGSALTGEPDPMAGL